MGASEPSDSLASFSYFGSWVTLEAPGEGIVSAVPDGGTGVWAGTSMAAPLVAGEAALVRSLAPGASTADVVSDVTRGAVRVNSAVRMRVDAAAALAQTAQHN